MSSTSTPWRVSICISRAMTVCSSTCNSLSVGASASMKAGGPSAPEWDTLGVGDEAGRLLLHQAVQRALLGTVGCAVERGAIGSRLGLLRRGSHDGLPVG